MFAGNKDEQEDVTEEIISMVDEGHEQGFFVGSEAEMIRNIFEYGEKDAKDIMTHRKNIVALNGDETIKDVLPFILAQNYSRFPVYEDDIDNITGTLHLRDAVKCHFDEALREVPIKDLKVYTRDVSFIPETKSIDKLFKQMQTEQSHMAIVIDEYGQTSGLVTMEDILEEVFGNIQDEYDEEEEEITKQPDGTYIVMGMTELEDLEALLGISFPEEDEFDTLNGFLVDELDHIPAEEEKCVITYEGYCFRVLSVQDNMIREVSISKEDGELPQEQEK